MPQILPLAADSPLRELPQWCESVHELRTWTFRHLRVEKTVTLQVKRPRPANHDAPVQSVIANRRPCRRVLTRDRRGGPRVTDDRLARSKREMPAAKGRNDAGDYPFVGMAAPGRESAPLGLESAISGASPCESTNRWHPAAKSPSCGRNTRRSEPDCRARLCLSNGRGDRPPRTRRPPVS